MTYESADGGSDLDRRSMIMALALRFQPFGLYPLPGVASIQGSSLVLSQMDVIFASLDLHQMLMIKFGAQPSDKSIYGQVIPLSSSSKTFLYHVRSAGEISIAAMADGFSQNSALKIFSELKTQALVKNESPKYSKPVEKFVRWFSGFENAHADCPSEPDPFYNIFNFYTKVERGVEKWSTQELARGLEPGLHGDISQMVSGCAVSALRALWDVSLIGGVTLAVTAAAQSTDRSARTAFSWFFGKPKQKSQDGLQNVTDASSTRPDLGSQIWGAVSRGFQSVFSFAGTALEKTEYGVTHPVTTIEVGWKEALNEGHVLAHMVQNAVKGAEVSLSKMSPADKAAAVCRVITLATGGYHQLRYQLQRHDNRIFEITHDLHTTSVGVEGVDDIRNVILNGSDKDWSKLLTFGLKESPELTPERRAADIYDYVVQHGPPPASIEGNADGNAQGMVEDNGIDKGSH